jgi:hypothetical protein
MSNFKNKPINSTKSGIKTNDEPLFKLDFKEGTPVEVMGYNEDGEFVYGTVSGSVYDISGTEGRIAVFGINNSLEDSIIQQENTNIYVYGGILSNKDIGTNLDQWTKPSYVQDGSIIAYSQNLDSGKGVFVGAVVRNSGGAFGGHFITYDDSVSPDWLIGLSKNVGGDTDLHYLANSEAASTVMTIQKAGNVGIGVTSPQSRLSVAGSNSLDSSFSLTVANITDTIFSVRNDGMVSSLNGYAINNEWILRARFGGLYIGQNTGINVQSGAVQNISIGANSLYNNIDGLQNTAIGVEAQYHSNTSYNVSIGYRSLYSNVINTSNVAIGNLAMANFNPPQYNGDMNVAIGAQSMINADAGVENVAIGVGSLSKVNSSRNVAIGTNALNNLTTNNFISNVAIGYMAGKTIVTGGGNVLIGALADADESVGFSVVLGNEAFSTESHQFVLGSNLSRVDKLFLGRGVHAASGVLSWTHITVTGVEPGEENGSAVNSIFYIDGAKGTGTGLGGDIVFRVSPAGSSGSQQNNQIEALRVKQNGNIYVGLNVGDAGTSKLDIAGIGYNQLRLRTSYTPTNSADVNGNVGDVAWDDSHIYIKTSIGWKRTALEIF